MDFITRLPKFNGYDAIFVIVDRLNKYATFIPLKHPYLAKSIAEVFTREVIRLHGIPASIASDWDSIFEYFLERAILVGRDATKYEHDLSPRDR